MVLIDTNLIVRLCTLDNEELVKKAKKLINAHQEVHVTESVFMESVYVLENVYKMNRVAIVDSLQFLFRPKFIIDNSFTISTACNLYPFFTTLSFTDCTLLVSKALMQKEILTFDKDLKKKTEKMVEYVNDPIPPEARAHFQ